MSNNEGTSNKGDRFDQFQLGSQPQTTKAVGASYLLNSANAQQMPEQSRVRPASQRRLQHMSRDSDSKNTHTQQRPQLRMHSSGDAHGPTLNTHASVNVFTANGFTHNRLMMGSQHETGQVVSYNLVKGSGMQPSRSDRNLERALIQKSNNPGISDISKKSSGMRQMDSQSLRNLHSNPPEDKQSSNNLFETKTNPPKVELLVPKLTGSTQAFKPLGNLQKSRLSQGGNLAQNGTQNSSQQFKKESNGKFIVPLSAYSQPLTSITSGDATQHNHSVLNPGQTSESQGQSSQQMSPNFISSRHQLALKQAASMPQTHKEAASQNTNNSSNNGHIIKTIQQTQSRDQKFINRQRQIANQQHWAVAEQQSQQSVSYFAGRSSIINGHQNTSQSNGTAQQLVKRYNSTSHLQSVALKGTHAASQGQNTMTHQSSLHNVTSMSPSNVSQVRDDSPFHRGVNQSSHQSLHASLQQSKLASGVTSHPSSNKGLRILKPTGMIYSNTGISNNAESKSPSAQKMSASNLSPPKTQGYQRPSITMLQDKQKMQHQSYTVAQDKRNKQLNISANTVTQLAAANAGSATLHSFSNNSNQALFQDAYATTNTILAIKDTTVVSQKPQVKNGEAFAEATSSYHQSKRSNSRSKIQQQMLKPVTMRPLKQIKQEIISRRAAHDDSEGTANWHKGADQNHSASIPVQNATKLESSLQPSMGALETFDDFNDKGDGVSNSAQKAVQASAANTKNQQALSPAKQNLAKSSSVKQFRLVTKHKSDNIAAEKSQQASHVTTSGDKNNGPQSHYSQKGAPIYSKQAASMAGQQFLIEQNKRNNYLQNFDSSIKNNKNLDRSDAAQAVKDNGKMIVQTDFFVPSSRQSNNPSRLESSLMNSPDPLQPNRTPQATQQKQAMLILPDGDAAQSVKAKKCSGKETPSKKDQKHSRSGSPTHKTSSQGSPQIKQPSQLSVLFHDKDQQRGQPQMDSINLITTGSREVEHHQFEERRKSSLSQAMQQIFIVSSAIDANSLENTGTAKATPEFLSSRKPNDDSGLNQQAHQRIDYEGFPVNKQLFATDSNLIVKQDQQPYVAKIQGSNSRQPIVIINEDDRPQKQNSASRRLNQVLQGSSDGLSQPKTVANIQSIKSPVGNDKQSMRSSHNNQPKQLGLKSISQSDNKRSTAYLTSVEQAKTKPNRSGRLYLPEQGVDPQHSSMMTKSETNLRQPHDATASRQYQIQSQNRLSLPDSIEVNSTNIEQPTGSRVLQESLAEEIKISLGGMSSSPRSGELAPGVSNKDSPYGMTMTQSSLSPTTGQNIRTRQSVSTQQQSMTHNNPPKRHQDKTTISLKESTGKSWLSLSQKKTKKNSSRTSSVATNNRQSQLGQSSSQQVLAKSITQAEPQQNSPLQHSHAPKQTTASTKGGLADYYKKNSPVVKQTNNSNSTSSKGSNLQQRQQQQQQTQMRDKQREKSEQQQSRQTLNNRSKTRPITSGNKKFVEGPSHVNKHHRQASKNSDSASDTATNNVSSSAANLVSRNQLSGKIQHIKSSPHAHEATFGSQKQQRRGGAKKQHISPVRQQLTSTQTAWVTPAAQKNTHSAQSLDTAKTKSENFSNQDEVSIPFFTPNQLINSQAQIQLRQPNTLGQNNQSVEKRRMSENTRLQKTNSLSSKVVARKASDLPSYLLPPLNYGLGEEHHRQYTLVLDLDETLVHFDQRKRNYRPRPHAMMFLKEMSRRYELVVFTAGLKEYADWILDDFDKQRFIRYRLYRNSCKFRKGVYVKDLSRIGRDLSKTIIVDNIAENYELQPDNGINILSWFSNTHDTELLKMEPILAMFVDNQVSDVRNMIGQYFKINKKGLILGHANVNRGRKASAPNLQTQLQQKLQQNSSHPGLSVYQQSRGSHQVSHSAVQPHLAISSSSSQFGQASGQVIASQGTGKVSRAGQRESKGPRQSSQQKSTAYGRQRDNDTIVHHHTKPGGSKVLQNIQIGRMRHQNR